MQTPAFTAGEWRTRSLVLLLLWLATPMALAQVDATQWRFGTVNLNEGWREHDGDNPAWAQTNFDDSGWKTVELDDLGAATLGTRWYRLEVKLAPNHPHLHVLIAGGEGTYEMYVNGQQVQGTELRPLFGVTRPTERVYSLRDEDTELTIALRRRRTRPMRAGICRCF